MEGRQGTHCRLSESDLSLQVTPESHPATGWLFFFPDGIWFSSPLAHLLGSTPAANRDLLSKAVAWSADKAATRPAVGGEAYLKQNVILYP